MTEKPTIELGDEQSYYDKEDGVYRDYIPVKIRARDRDEAREIASVFSDAWDLKHGGSE